MEISDRDRLYDARRLKRWKVEMKPREAIAAVEDAILGQQYAWLTWLWYARWCRDGLAILLLVILSGSIHIVSGATIEKIQALTSSRRIVCAEARGVEFRIDVPVFDPPSNVDFYLLGNYRLYGLIRVVQRGKVGISVARRYNPSALRALNLESGAGFTGTGGYLSYAKLQRWRLACIDRINGNVHGLIDCQWPRQGNAFYPNPRPLIKLRRFNTGFQSILSRVGGAFGGIGASLSDPVRLQQRFPLSPGIVRVNGKNDQGDNTHPQVSPQKAVGLFIIGILAMAFFWSKVYLYADPLRFSGWLWFSAFLVSFCLLYYGVGLMIDCFDNVGIGFVSSGDKFVNQRGQLMQCGARQRHLLIREAIAATRWYWPDAPELGMVTFIDREKTRHKRDPGRCYLKAGFQVCGETKGGLLALQMLPGDMPEPMAPHGAQLWLEAST